VILRAAIRNMVELEMVVVGGEKQGREKEGGRRGSLRRGHDARCWNVGRRRAQSFPLLKLDGVFLISCPKSLILAKMSEEGRKCALQSKSSTRRLKLSSAFLLFTSLSPHFFIRLS